MNPLDIEYITPSTEPPPYLQVRDPNGDLIGIMKGPFHMPALRAGYVQFLVFDSRYDMARLDTAYQYRHATYQVKEYWVKKSAKVVEVFYCLEVPFHDADIYQIRSFRWTTKKVGICKCTQRAKSQGAWTKNCPYAPVHEAMRDLLNTPPPRQKEAGDPRSEAARYPPDVT